MVTVYTALFGDVRRDQVRPPRFANARYVCFTDAPVVPSGWERAWLPSINRSPTFLARLVKTRPDRWFGGDVTTIWLDASCELLVDPATLPLASSAPVMALRHPDRSSVEAEAAVIVHDGLVPANVVRQQLESYRAEGFATDAAGVTTTGFLVRTPAAYKFNLLWEDQIIRHNLRDQLSVDYCAWATETEIVHLAGHYRANPFMRYHRHARIPA